MSEIYSVRPIAYVHNDLFEKFGAPRQSGLAPSLVSEIVFLPEYGREEAFRGLERFSHIWVLWMFSNASEEGISDTVRPPRLGGNERVGVYGTRSPFRTNRIGLSSVRLLNIERRDRTAVLTVGGADMQNGTPVVDIKPYIPYTDIHTDAVGGFADTFSDYRLNVVFPDELLIRIEPEKRAALIEILENDPRPAYHSDGGRVYKMTYGKYGVHFTVSDRVLAVSDIIYLPS